MAGPYAVRGTLYVGAISDLSGTDGTQIKGVEEGEIELRVNVDSVRTANLDRNMNPLPSNLSRATVSVVLRLRSHDTDSAAMAFRWLNASGKLNTNNAQPGDAETVQALVVRPADTTADYFYSPAVSLVRASGFSIFYSQSRPVFEGAELEFECGIAIGSPSEPAAIWDSHDTVVAAYAGLS